MARQAHADGHQVSTFLSNTFLVHIWLFGWAAEPPKYCRECGEQHVKNQIHLPCLSGKLGQSCRWGHKLAQGAPGKGHGSRAFLHALRHGAAIHDASYWLAMELSGPCDSLGRVLTTLW